MTEPKLQIKDMMHFVYIYRYLEAREDKSSSLFPHENFKSE